MRSLLDSVEKLLCFSKNVDYGKKILLPKKEQMRKCSERKDNKESDRFHLGRRKFSAFFIRK